MSDTTNWFARKLGTPEGAPPPAQAPRTPTPAAPQPPPASPAPAPGADPKPGEPGSFSYAMQVGQTSGGPAHKTGKVSTCPGCASGNYIEMPNGKHSCFDCGYPLIQYGSDLGEGNLK